MYWKQIHQIFVKHWVMENVGFCICTQEEIRLNFPGSGSRTNYIFGSTQDKIIYHIWIVWGLKIKFKNYKGNAFVFRTYTEGCCVKEKANQTWLTDRVSDRGWTVTFAFQFNLSNNKNLQNINLQFWKKKDQRCINILIFETDMSWGRGPKRGRRGWRNNHTAFLAS